MLALVPSQKPQRHVLALWAHRTTLNDLMQNGQSLWDAHSSFQLVFCQHVASFKLNTLIQEHLSDPLRSGRGFRFFVRGTAAASGRVDVSKRVSIGTVMSRLAGHAAALSRS
jgi:hypothetical protein